MEPTPEENSQTQIATPPSSVPDSISSYGGSVVEATPPRRYLPPGLIYDMELLNNLSKQSTPSPVTFRDKLLDLFHQKVPSPESIEELSQELPMLRPPILSYNDLPPEVTPPSQPAPAGVINITSEMDTVPSSPPPHNESRDEKLKRFGATAFNMSFNFSWLPPTKAPGIEKNHAANIIAHAWRRYIGRRNLIRAYIYAQYARLELGFYVIGAACEENAELPTEYIQKLTKLFNDFQTFYKSDFVQDYLNIYEYAMMEDFTQEIIFVKLFTCSLEPKDFVTKWALGRSVQFHPGRGRFFPFIIIDE